MDVGHPTALNERLRQAGLRATQPRLAIYRALESLGGHRSADDVYDHIVSSGEQLSRASVYNALAALSAAGLVLSADAGPGPALYETATVSHHHAVCRLCGQVSDVACVVGSKPCLSPGDEWGEVDEAQIIFRGVCRACSRHAGRRRTGSRQGRQPERGAAPLE
jgi:Fur family ferric uptake transcriptional regulator